MTNYLDVLGAVSERMITIRVDPLALAVAKGGAKGQVASFLIPATVSATVYDEMAARLRDGFAKEGVQADVRVVEAPTVAGLPNAKGSDLGRGVVAGGVLTVLGWIAWDRLIKGFFGR